MIHGSSEQQLALERARTLERGGEVDAAAQAFARAGVPQEAARVLANAGRDAEAGDLLVESYRILSGGGAALSPAQRKAANLALRLFARAGDAGRAAQLQAVLAPTPIPLRQVAAEPWIPSPGAMVAGRYRIERVLGQGGMATVFEAKDLELGESVALKIYAAPVQDEGALEKFRQELKLTRQLAHPNIIRVFDIGLEAGRRFISMELLSGTDLRHLLGKPVEIARGLSLLVQACAGLQAAHEQGVIHRDVKPENLFVAAGDRLKVMDFGIARQSATKVANAGGMSAGTPHYVSPEQISRFEEVGPAADLYSLGVVAYEMFTGSVPFDAPDLSKLLNLHLSAEPPAPGQRNLDLPADLEQILLRLLEKSPARRFASCRELASAFEPIRQRYAFEDFL